MVTHALRTRPLNLKKRSGKKLSSVQAYTRLYYHRKLRPIVAEKWAEHIAENPDVAGRKGESLRYRNAVIRDFFNAEPDDVKAEVEQKREEGLFSEDEDIESNDGFAVDAFEKQRRTKVLGFRRKVLLFSKQGFLTNTTF
jgi:hypothetical protein